MDVEKYTATRDNRIETVVDNLLYIGDASRGPYNIDSVIVEPFAAKCLEVKLRIGKRIVYRMVTHKENVDLTKVREHDAENAEDYFYWRIVCY